MNACVFYMTCNRGSDLPSTINSVDSEQGSMQIESMKNIRLFAGLLVIGGALRATGQETILSQYEAKFQNGLNRVESIFREKRLAMPTAHVNALKRLEAEYQRAGDLESMLAVQKERKRFVLDPRGTSIPAIESPPELAALSRQYKAQFQAAAVSRDQSLAELKKRYLDALKALQVKLTQQGSIEEAKAVMQAISSAGGMVWKPVDKQPDSPAPTTANDTPAKASSGESGDDFFGEWFD
jgi:hypothetical protein